MASIEEMYNQIYAEVQGHIPKLAATQWLWRQARTWIGDQAKLLHQQANQLVTQDHWPDAAGRQFLARVNQDLAVMRSWTDPGSRVTVGNHVTTSNVFDTINALDSGLWAAQRAAERLVIHYNGLSDEDKGKQRQDIDGKIAAEITKLVPLYTAAATGMRGAVGVEWKGPRAATSRQGRQNPATNPGPASASPGTAPSPTEPQPQEPAPTEPTTPETTDPLKAALEAAPGALDALSQAMQSAQQLLGGGTGSPLPTPLDPLDPLGPGDSLSPLEVAQRLARVEGTSDPSGLPSLAGGGVSPVGGSAAGGSLSPVAPVSPSPGGVGSAAFPPVTSLSATGSGGASTSGSPGTMPPAQQQPQHGGAKRGGGIKPGAAEHAATGRPRERKSGVTPGVSLLGRSGRGRPADRTAEPAPAPRRWDRENDTVQLLDEELWQVEQEDSGPRYRAGQ
ncbi:hypothetical protein ACFQ05_02040 [Amycolatopsis umgeniensis]|uniref:Uncharacterized protein n=1 Tax=Amycolatopsis umgeniensis TaxID=336628 RepID=A0A841B143_9PSEU|nr:hypothetical protein [Amycolatopsis umgeniensis]MBB5852038.1 hypothetical protein [Amycolatopsis umgeniensis]